METIFVKTTELAAILNEIAKWSDNLNDELTKIARETAQAQTALEAGVGIPPMPSMTKAEQYSASRQALVPAAKLMGATDEELKQATQPGRPYFMGG